MELYAILKNSVVTRPTHSKSHLPKIFMAVSEKYYIIIDFNEVDIRIYLPEKVIIHRGRQAEVNITFKGR